MDRPRDAAEFSSGLAKIIRTAVNETSCLALVYGSTAYGLSTKSSDVDLVVITDEISSVKLSELIHCIVLFHQEWGLTLDDEVPFERKIVATWADVNAAMVAEFLPRRNGRRYVSPVVKSKEFLTSEEIRLRLLLNALTGKCIQLVGDSAVLEQTQARAREAWFELLPELVPMSNRWTISEFVDTLIGRPPEDGEMFLGFKAHPTIRNFLLEAFTEAAQRRVALGTMMLEGNKYCYCRRE